MKWEQRDVNSQQLISHDEHWYSVPERYVGSTLRVGVGVFKIMLVDEIIENLREYYHPALEILEKYKSD